MRVLIVEDDALIAKGLVAGLKAHDMTADAVHTAADAETAISTSHFNAMVLDLGLPDKDGTELLKHLRSQDNHLPVLILTARDALEDRINGLDLGGDDYLTKPFDLAELVARLHAITRRAAGRSINQVQAGPITLDPSSGDVWLHDEKITLTRRETALLGSLMQSQGQCLTPEKLKDSLYGYDIEIESNALNVHIHNLRRKLGNDTIETVRGMGYRIPADLAP